MVVGTTVYGIVSWSLKQNGQCAKYPGLFTRVSEYIDWIVMNAK